jgi:hypothetical protein
VARGDPCLGTSTVRASKTGFEPALPERSNRHLHHQRWMSRASMLEAANQKRKFSARRILAPQFASPAGLALPSVSGLSPRSLRQAPRLGTRVTARAPGSGSPVPAFAGQTFKDASDNKKPSGASGSGGSVMSGLSILLSKQERSHEPGASYRSAGGRSRAVQIFCARIASCGSPLSRKHDVCEGAGHTPSNGECQPRRCVQIATVDGNVRCRMLQVSLLFARCSVPLSQVASTATALFATRPCAIVLLLIVTLRDLPT